MGIAQKGPLCLALVSHPFLVDMVWSSRDANKFLYMLFPYVCGGELFSYLRRYGHYQVLKSIANF